MKSEELLYSMEHVGSDLLAAAEQTVLVRKHTSWVKTAAAAVLALAVGVGGFLLLKNLHANNDPVPATNPSTVENHTTEATETQNHDTVIDPLSLVGESLSESGSYTDSAGNQWDYSYELPCINADTTGAKAINEEIERVYGEIVREAHEYMEQNCSLIWISIDYDATAWNDILSVKVHSSGHVGGMEEYRIFNYDCSLGRWITTQELLDRMGISEEAFREACRIQFEENEYHEPDGSGIFFDDDEMIKKDGNYYRYRNKGTSDEKLAEVQIHPYQDGRVEMIAPISLGAGAAYYDFVLPLDLSPEHEPETTEEQDADALRAELDALFAVDESHMGQNFYHQALTSAFESPENVKLYQLFHSGTDRDYVESAEEKAKLDEAFPMQFERVRVSVGEMNGILNQVFGIGFEQVNGHQAFLDDEEKVYLPETDSYYWECTEGNWLYGFSIQDVRTLEDGRVLFTYHREFWDAPEGIWTVCLKKDNGVYHIISNLPGEWVTEKAEQENEPETTEQQDADALRAELEALFRDEDCDNLNPYVRALTCYYESPALVDFRELFYCSLGLELYEDEATKEMLKSKYPAFFSNLYTDCDRLTEAEMDKVLRQVFGVGIDQTRKKNLDSFFYVPETDSYYHEHGDTNALGTSPLIQDVRTEEDGLVLFTYKITEGFVGDGKFSNIRTVALKKENGVYHIVSHLPGEFTTAGDLALAPCTDWRMEAEAGDEGPDVRELKVSSTMRYFYQSGDQDSEFNYWCQGSIVYQEDGTLQINIYEIPEDGSIGERTGEPSFDATYACTRENGTIVLTQLSDEGFYNDPKGTVLRFVPDTED
ncbi:MAG: hypothetical protein IKS21_02860 [Oscillospiraceae bacterium]|nr:hypothetical protein [Oscillospiraceae bacterium]